MSELIKKCEKDLVNLSKASRTEKIKIVKKCKKCLLKAISEIVRNCLLGNISMNTCQRSKLKRYRKILNLISKRSIPLEKKRLLIIQKGAGFLSILLPIALETVKFLFEKFKTKRSSD
jgi:hypothetical protein